MVKTKVLDVHWNGIYKMIYGTLEYTSPTFIYGQKVIVLKTKFFESQSSEFLF